MPNVLRATFVNRREVRGLQRVTVRQKFSNHTLAFLDYRIDHRFDYLLPPENTPVQASFGRSPMGVSMFYGYVNHYETVTENGRALARLVAVGTSKPMNAVRPASWQDVTRSSIARDIAARHRLRSVVHDHPYVIDNWATGNRSDFQALKALAEETGYRLWVDGSTVWFLDPSKLLRNASNMSAVTVTQRDIRNSRVLGGSNIPGEILASKRRVQFGLDYRTNEFFESTSGQTSNPTEMLTGTANTFSEAQDIADAADRRQQDYYALKAEISGNARVYPGALVNVESGRVNTDQGGVWIASETEHEVTQSEFTTNFTATRGLDRQPLTRTTTTTRGASGLTQAVTRGGLVWEAALQEQVRV